MKLEVFADGISKSDADLSNHRTACRAIVKKDVPSRAVVVGTDNKIIGDVFNLKCPYGLIDKPYNEKDAMFTGEAMPWYRHNKNWMSHALPLLGHGRTKGLLNFFDKKYENNNPWNNAKHIM